LAPSENRSALRNLMRRKVFINHAPLDRFTAGAISWAFRNSFVLRNNVISFSMVMSTTNSTRDPYLVKSLIHASQVLGVFQFSGETLRLRDIALRSGLNKGMVFRLLYTLEKCGMVEKIGESAQTWLNAGAVGMVDDVHRRLMGPLSSAGPSTSGWGNKSNVRGSPWIRLVPTQCHPGPSWHVRAGQYGLASNPTRDRRR